MTRPSRRTMLLIVLLVEDDPELSDNLTEILQSFGCNVRAYANAAGALSFLEREHADCLLTDLRLPGQDGMAMLEELRRRQVMIPTIVMSGFVEPEHVRRAAELGVLDVQSKPINLQRLQHILERIAS